MAKFLNKLKAFFIAFGKGFVNFFKAIGLGIWHFIRGIGRAFKKFGRRFIDSSVWTKVSHFIMGFGNFARKQYVKGFIFIAIQIAFFTFFFVSPTTKEGLHLGMKAVPGFFTLGDSIGMQASDTSFAETGFYVISGNRVKTELILNTKDENNAGIRQKLVRVHSLFEASLQNEIAPNANFVVEKNTDQYKEQYSSRQWKNIITDTRFDTKDVYAMNHYGKEDKIIFDGDDVVTLHSNKPLFGAQNNYNEDELVKQQEAAGIENDEARKTDYSYLAQYIPNNEQMDYLKQFITLYQGNDVREDIPDYILYYDEGASNPEENDYYYYFCFYGQPQGRKKYSVQFNDTYLNSPEMEGFELSAYTYSYHPDLVTSAVDNSFLLLLYGLLTIAIMAGYLVLWNLNIASSYTNDLKLKEGKEKPSTFIEDCKALFDGRFHVTMLAPAITFMIIFTIVPTILMIIIAFTDMTGTSSTAGTKLINWVGFQNFIDLFSQAEGSEISREVGRNFLPVFTWTIEWALIATFSCYFGGIFLALLINKKSVRCKKVWRTIFILTIAIPQFITLLIIRNLLKESGPINTMFGTAIDFLGQGSKSMTMSAWIPRSTVLVVNLYIGIPYTMLMTSGILMNIPADLYEAATIDGANKWQMFRKITLPYIIFVTTPYLISSFIGNITSFNTIFLLTGGGPAFPMKPGVPSSIAGQTDLLVTWLYKLTITNYRYNAGSIIGILTFIITASITLICYRNSKAYKEEDTFQ